MVIKEFIKPKNYYGVTSVGDSINDFEICGEVSLPPLVKQDTTIYEYNQGNSKNCILYGPFGALSDLMNYKFSTKEIDEIVAMSYARGRSPKGGWTTQSGVKCVCDYRNAKFPENKVAYFKISVLSNNFEDAMGKLYTVVGTMQGNFDYVRDIYDNGIIDKKEYGILTYGHCFGYLGREDKMPDYKDNYKGRLGAGNIKTNICDVLYYKDLVNNGVYYPTAYLLLPENSLKLTIEEIKALKAQQTIINTAIQANSDLRHTYPETESTIKDHLHEANQYLRGLLLEIESKLNDVI